MLSIKDCRQFLGDRRLTDEQVKLMRNFIYKIIKRIIKQEVLRGSL